MYLFKWIEINVKSYSPNGQVEDWIVAGWCVGLGLFHTYAVPFGSVRFRCEPKTNETPSHIHSSHTDHIRLFFFRTFSGDNGEKSHVVSL